MTEREVPGGGRVTGKTEEPRLVAGMTQREYYHAMRSRLPEKHRRSGEILDRVNKHYVKAGRDGALAESFSKFIVWITSEQRHELAGKGDAFYVTGESGAGKTDICRNLLRTHPVLQPMQTPLGAISPAISISLPGPATLKILALRILRAAGYPMDGRKREAELWEELPRVLQDNGVLIVHIDEFQHLFHPGCDYEGLVKYIKGLMNNEAWPVSFIISGMPKVRDIIINDPQAERRNSSFTLPSIEMPKQKDRVVEIIESLARIAGMDVSALLNSDMPERIAHAANYQFGRICEVTLTAIQEAALVADQNGAEGEVPKLTLTSKHFARAYAEHSDTRGRGTINPFISPDWARLPPGYFTLKSKKQDETEYDEFDDV